MQFQESKSIADGQDSALDFKRSFRLGIEIFINRDNLRVSVRRVHCDFIKLIDQPAGDVNFRSSPNVENVPSFGRDRN